MANPVDAILGVVKKCMDAKERVKQNKKKCAHLLENLQALGPTLFDIEKSEGALAHQETLENIKVVVNEAETLLKQQFTRSYVTQFCLSSSVAEQFTDINQRLRDQRENLTASLTTRMATRLATQNSGSAPTSAPEEVEIVTNSDVEVLHLWRKHCPDLAQFWPEDADPSTWMGLQFDDNGSAGRVSILVLDVDELRSLDILVEPLVASDEYQGPRKCIALRELPKVFGRLNQISQLWLGHCQLTSLPPELGQLSTMVKLSLSNNNLKSLPAEIGRLHLLKTLILESNQLTTLPDEIGWLTSLEVLDVEDNKLTTLPAEIGRLTSLQHLHLGNNKLTTLPAEIGALKSLKQLSLSNNQLKTLPTEFGNIARLEEINLSKNKLTALPPTFQAWFRVTTLNLSDNLLTALPVNIENAVVMENLFLDNNKLTNISAEIGQLKKLKMLSLAGNQLTILPAEIGRLKWLEQLDIRDNKLTSLPAEITKIGTLKYLQMESNQLTSLPAEIYEMEDDEDCVVTFDEHLLPKKHPLEHKYGEMKEEFDELRWGIEERALLPGLILNPDYPPKLRKKQKEKLCKLTEDCIVLLESMDEKLRVEEEVNIDHELVEEELESMRSFYAELMDPDSDWPLMKPTKEEEVNPPEMMEEERQGSDDPSDKYINCKLMKKEIDELCTLLTPNLIEDPGFSDTFEGQYLINKVRELTENCLTTAESLFEESDDPEIIEWCEEVMPDLRVLVVKYQ